jgi:hypothetical protein
VVVEHTSKRRRGHVLHNRNDERREWAVMKVVAGRLKTTRRFLFITFALIMLTTVTYGITLYIPGGSPPRTIAAVPPSPKMVLDGIGALPDQFFSFRILNPEAGNGNSNIIVGGWSKTANTCVIDSTSEGNTSGQRLLTGLPIPPNSPPGTTLVDCFFVVNEFQNQFALVAYYSDGEMDYVNLSSTWQVTGLTQILPPNSNIYPIFSNSKGAATGLIGTTPYLWFEACLHTSTTSSPCSQSSNDWYIVVQVNLANGSVQTANIIQATSAIYAAPGGAEYPDMVFDSVHNVIVNCDFSYTPVNFPLGIAESCAALAVPGLTTPPPPYPPATAPAVLADALINPVFSPSVGSLFSIHYGSLFAQQPVFSSYSSTSLPFTFYPDSFNDPGLASSFFYYDSHIVTANNYTFLYTLSYPAFTTYQEGYRPLAGNNDGNGMVEGSPTPQNAALIPSDVPAGFNFPDTAFAALETGISAASWPTNSPQYIMFFPSGPFVIPIPNTVFATNPAGLSTPPALAGPPNGTSCGQSDPCIAFGITAPNSTSITSAVYYWRIIPSSNLNLEGVAFIAEGTLSIVPPNSLNWNGSLTGTDQTLSVSGPVKVIDATGTKLGWHVTAQATQFTNASNQVLDSSGNPIAITGGGTSPPSASCDSGSTCILPSPSGSVVYPVSLPTTPPPLPNSNAPSAVVYSANSATGVGANVLSTIWTAFIPANTYAGTYNGTIDLEVAAGP